MTKSILSLQKCHKLILVWYWKQEAGSTVYEFILPPTSYLITAS